MVVSMGQGGEFRTVSASIRSCLGTLGLPEVFAFLSEPQQKDTHITQLQNLKGP